MVSMAISLPLRISWPFPNNRTLYGTACRRVQQVAQLQLVERGRDDQVGYRTECCHVEYAVVRCSVLSDQSGPVQAEYDFQLLEGDIVYDAVVCPLHEGRVDVAERQVSRGGQSCRECDGMLFGNAYVKCPFGNFLHHDTHTAAGGHRRCNGYNLPVGSGQFQKGFSEYVLVSGGSA